MNASSDVNAGSKGFKKPNAANASGPSTMRVPANFAMMMRCSYPARADAVGLLSRKRNMANKRRVLFLRKGNSARSQMAEGAKRSR
jgi:hypothetical protein